MKKSLLTISTLLCCFCLTYCKHNPSAHFANFVKPDLTPEAYETFDKPKINLEDPAIVEKIHQLDIYFDTKVRNGFNGSVLISFKGTPIFERYYGYKNY